MAKTTNNPKTPQKKNDLSNYYTDLSFVLPEKKQELWASMYLFFAKKNSVLFLDRLRAAAYRKTDSLDLDKTIYKQMVDPITPLDNGGEAKYFASDWKANPIYIHLKNIIKADIQRTAKEIECNFTDKFAKTRKMRDNDRIVYQKAFRALINEYAPQVGLTGISDNQDPYKWVQNLSNKNKAKNKPKDGQPQQQPQDGEKGQQPDTVDSFIDLIKNQISDSQDMALYNEFIYKGDYEISMELGIKHFMLNQNKWLERWSDEFLDDIMHFNKACGEWYTDEITGRPVIERFIPEKLYVSPFRRRDGEDLMHYFIEYDISFGDFIRTMGRDLTPQKLKDVFEYNKTQGASHGLVWDKIQGNGLLRDATKIRVGKCACLTQDYEINLDDYQAKYPGYTSSQPVSWEKLLGQDDKPTGKNYNVWRSFYYLPPTERCISNADFSWQSQFIFKLEKNQDQFRYGEGGRYSKSPLVIFENSHQASFTDIVQSWMPKIHHAYHKFQNCLINDFDTVVMSDTLLAGLLSAVDEDNKIGAFKKDQNPTGGNGQDTAMAMWKMMRQSGQSFVRMTDPKTGDIVLDPSKLQFQIKNGYLEKAEKWLLMIAQMYQQLTQSLAFSDVGEGQDAKPRTSVASLQETIKSSKNGSWFIQKGYEEFLKGYAERFVRYILMIKGETKKYNFYDRWEEFKSVIGEANGLALEGLEDVPAESIGLTINYVDNSQKKELISQLCVERVKNGMLDDDTLYLLMGVDNWKYMFVLMRMAMKKRKQEMAHQEELKQQNIMDQKKMDLQIAQALAKTKSDGKNENIQVQAAGAAEVEKLKQNMKHESQSQLTDQKKEAKMQEESHRANLEQQKPAVTSEAAA